MIMNKEVPTPKPEDQLITAANTMLERKIGYVVLVEKQRVVGIVTESDLEVLRVHARPKSYARERNHDEASGDAHTSGANRGSLRAHAAKQHTPPGDRQQGRHTTWHRDNEGSSLIRKTDKATMILRKALAYQNVSVYDCHKAFGARIRALSRPSLMTASWSAQTKPRVMARFARMESG
jgi:CBS domain-containing protein